jgi:hypothetical protein
MCPMWGLGLVRGIVPGLEKRKQRQIRYIMGQSTVTELVPRWLQLPRSDANVIIAYYAHCGSLSLFRSFKG